MRKLIQETGELMPVEELAVQGIIALDSDEEMEEVVGGLGKRSIYAKKRVTRAHPNKVHEAAKSVLATNPNVAVAVVNYLVEPVDWRMMRHEGVQREYPDMDYGIWFDIVFNKVSPSRNLFLASDIALELEVGHEIIADYYEELMQRCVGETNWNRVSGYNVFILSERDNLGKLKDGKLYEEIIGRLPRFISPEVLEGLPDEMKEFNLGWPALRPSNLPRLNDLLDQISSLTPKTRAYNKRIKELDEGYCGPGHLERFMEKDQGSMNRILSNLGILQEDLRVAIGQQIFSEEYGKGKSAIDVFDRDYNDLVGSIISKASQCWETYRENVLGG